MADASPAERRNRRVYLPEGASPAVAHHSDMSGIAPEKYFPRMEDGSPIIYRIARRINDLEHRLGWLEEKFDPDRSVFKSGREMGEIQALRAAISVMRYHALEVGGDDSVLLLLEEVVLAFDGEDRKRRGSAIKRAKMVLEDLTS